MSRPNLLHTHSTLLDRADLMSRRPRDDAYALTRVNVVEHLLCKHAFISPKSLNRRLFTVQNPLQIGLLIGLQNNTGHGGRSRGSLSRPELEDEVARGWRYRQPLFVREATVHAVIGKPIPKRGALFIMCESWFPVTRRTFHGHISTRFLAMRRIWFLAGF